jgi:hypothetical protein
VLGADLIGTCQWPLEPRLDVRLACDLAADVADDTTKPAAQDAQFATVALELFGVGIAPRHHGGALGDAQIGLPQSHAVLSGQAIEPLDRRMQELGVGRERNGLGLHRGVHGDASKIVGPQCAGLVRNPQTLGQQQLQLVAEPVAPMAQVRALVREDMLEELRPGEVLEIGVVDPALAHLFI